MTHFSNLETDKLIAKKVGINIEPTAEPSAELQVEGNIEVSGTVDGRDISEDGKILDKHVGEKGNPHETTAAQVGAEPADSQIQEHIKKTTGNPHGTKKEDIGLSKVTDNKQVIAATSSVDKNFVTWSGTAGDAVADSGNKAADFAPATHDHPNKYEPADSQIQEHIKKTTGNPHGTKKEDIGLSKVTDNKQVIAATSSVDKNFVTWSGTAGDAVADSGKKAADFAAATHDHAGKYEPSDSKIQEHLKITTTNPGNPHGTTKTHIGLEKVTNDKQVKATSSSVNG